MKKIKHYWKVFYKELQAWGKASSQAQNGSWNRANNNPG